MLAPSASTANWFWSNVADLSASEIVTRYKNLADIERASECSRATSRSPRIPPPARSHPRPRADLLPRSGALPGDAHAPQSERQQREPKTALEMLRRIQKHRATIGERTYTGISKTTLEQL